MIRIGHGYDVHRFAENRKLVLGGVELNYHLGLLGHSDADVLTHSICDALLGAAALGDIGRHFPDTDPNYKDANSIQLLNKVVLLLEKNSYAINNIDVTLIAQQPKICDFIESMRINIANACKIAFDFVNIKATTEEKLGFTGRLEGISAHAVCLIEKKYND